MAADCTRDDRARLNFEREGAGAMDRAEKLADHSSEGEEEGVLLYYKFVPLPEPEKIKNWLYDLSASLNLLGRIRVAPNGVNVTVGGKMAALKEHVASVGSNPLFRGTDFKLASSSGPVNARAAAECGFTTLSGRIVKELVTLGLHPSLESPTVLNAGRHLSAWEFHETIQNASQTSDAESQCHPVKLAEGRFTRHGGGDSMQSASQTGTDPSADNNNTESVSDGPGENLVSREDRKKVVVVDARNLYETRIGKFCPPRGVEVLDPTIRQYSDLPTWIDDNEDRLRNNQILMYCTGGVRCEMASSYIRSKGQGFEDVSQLSGGIQRYLEAFPAGGYFAGKNFVFDHRLAVPSSRSEIVGSCLICSAPYDDYASRCRCCLCRMLVLVCAKCQEGSGGRSNGDRYTCELCSRPRKDVATMQLNLRRGEIKDKSALKVESLPDPAAHLREPPTRKLKILCLHGFRQSASSLRGRLNALRKKLRHRVEFVFVDAPHEVPPINLGSTMEPSFVDEASICDAHSGDGQLSSHHTSRTLRSTKPSKKFAWFVKSETSELAPGIAAAKALVQNYHIDEDGGGCHQKSQAAAAADVGGRINESACGTICKSDELCSTSLEGFFPESGEDCLAHPDDCRSSTSAPQFQTQTEGWPMSLDYLKRIFRGMGPFDGVLGFSQGAAIAAALCTQRSSTSHKSRTSEDLDFRFALLCSGFWPKAVRFEEVNSLSSSQAHIDCPSLHIFGSSPGVDRQIESRESEELAKLFNPDGRMIVRHTVGHIIPTQPCYVEQYLQFFNQFD